MDESTSRLMQSLENSELILKASFGELLRSLRERMEFTRQQLSELSLVSYKTIVDIEYGEKAHLDRRTVTLLSKSLKLSGFIRRSFFVAAGLIPEFEAGLPAWSTELQEFHKGMKYPTIVADSLVDIQSLNAYLLALFEIDLAQLGDRIFDSAGPNVLRVMFDPLFNARRLFASEWVANAQLQILIFRYMSLPRQKEDRYGTLLQELHKLPDFSDIWHSTESMVLPLPPFLATINNSRFGRIRYMYGEAAVFGPYSEQMKAVFYLPAGPEDEKTFEMIRGSTANVAIEFVGDQKKMGRIL
ncbi:MAG: helix-turn-helix domain-containing protein [Anaerolineae bacterium]|nr:helix-turn-helix domain-containing protein [Anaerolineae bacterium]